jgi:hypothetical protein
MLGLLGSAMAGGAQAVSQVSEGRIEEKRAKALEKLRTMNNRAEGAIRFGQEQTLADTENSRRVAQDATNNEQATARIRLADELGRRTFEDVTDDNGRIVGQREAGSNQYTPYPTSAGQDMSLTNLQKAQVQSLTDRIKAIDDSTEYGVLSPEDMERRDAMELQLNALFSGSGIFSELYDGKGDGQGGETGTGNPAKAEKPAPESIGGLVGSAMNTVETQARVTVATDQINGLQDEADKLLQRIKKPSVMGSIGKPGSQPQVDSDAIEAAQDLVQRLLALEDDPATAEALTQRLRNNIKQRIMDIQRAGVPLNLNQ